MKRQFWLFKSEPNVFSIHDLKNSPNQTNTWDGVRNFQARNFLRDKVHVGDGVLFYHSTVLPSGIAGEAVVVTAGYPDPTQFSKQSEYFDPKSSPEKPIWYAVDVQFVRACKEIIPLSELRKHPRLRNMVVLRKGTRLSIQPVTPEEWKIILFYFSSPSSSSKLMRP